MGVELAAGIIGKLLLKGAMDVVGAGMIGGSAYGIWKLKNTPPEIVNIMRGRVYPQDMKGNPVISFEAKAEDVQIYKMRIPLGKSLEDFKACIPAIEDQMNSEVRIWGDDGTAVIECMVKPLPHFVTFQQYMFEALREHECGIIMGEGRKGLRIIDLTNPTTPHLLVGGATGGGKSNFLNVLICGTASAYAPWDVQFYLVDLKDGVEFAPYRELPHVQSITGKDGEDVRIIDNVDDCGNLLGSLASAIRERNTIFRDAGVRNISEYRKGGGEMPHIIVVADEIGDFASIGEKKVRDALFAGWATLARKGRSAGIHLVLCTQVPDAESVPRQLKGNIPVKLGFRMMKRENSETIFDSDIATRIPPIPGRAVLKVGDYENVQVPYLGLGDIEDQILPQLAGYFDILREIQAEKGEMEDITVA